MNVFDAAKSQQLALLVVAADVDDDAADRNISPDQALAISNSARDALDDGVCGDSEEVDWVGEYRQLREDGWPWRIAAYIAWAASPRRVGEVERWPGTLEELATQVLGLRTARAIRKWRLRNPAIEETIGLLQRRILEKSRAKIYHALIDSASTASYRNHNDRKLALEMLGDYTPKQDVTATVKRQNDLATLSDSELAALAGEGEHGSE